MALVGNWWLARVLRRHTAYPVGERVGQWLVDRQLKATIDFGILRSLQTFESTPAEALSD
jgi:hypothetical protein